MVGRVITAASRAFPDNYGEKASRRDRFVGGLQSFSDEDLVDRGIGARIVSIAIESNKVAAVANLGNEPIIKASPLCRFDLSMTEV